MFGDWPSTITCFLSLLFTGFAVKLMDDYLDAPFDICRGKHTLAGRMATATLPYALVCGLLGAYFNREISLSIFFACYALGMLTAPMEILPTRIPAYLEMALAVLASLVLTGWHQTLWAMAMVAVMDWLDDLVDASGDRSSGQRNIALKIGVVETLFIILAALCIAVVTNVSTTILSFVALTVITILAEMTTRTAWSIEYKGVDD